MCIAQGNILGRVVGSDTFNKMDPAIGAVEKWDAENVAPLWGMGKKAGAPASYTEVGYAPLQDVQTGQRRTAANPNSLLTGQSTARPAAVGRGMSLLGG